MDEILKSIVYNEKDVNGTNSDNDRHTFLNSDITTFTGFNQQQLTYIFRNYYQSLVNNEDRDSTFVTVDDVVLWFDKALVYDNEDIKERVQNLLPAFSTPYQQDPNKYDAYEILYFFILFADLDDSVKIEDLFDAFHFNVNSNTTESRQLSREEFLLSMKSLLSGIDKVYHHVLSLQYNFFSIIIIINRSSDENTVDDMNSLNKRDLASDATILDSCFHLLGEICSDPSLHGKPNWIKSISHKDFTNYFLFGNKYFKQFLNCTSKYAQISEEIETENIPESKPEMNEQFIGGDEFMAVKPWKGAIHAPSKPPPIINSPPDASLQLEWIYGYAAQNSHQNLYYTKDSNKIVYHSAGVGICYDIDKKIQSFNFGHDDDILCLAIHPSGEYIATGQIGKNPKVVIWNYNDPGNILMEIGGFHQRAILSIAFSPSGEYLVSVGQDDNHSIAVYKLNLQKNSYTKFSTATGSKEKTLECKFLSDTTLVSCGVKHLKYWTLNGKVLKNQNGLFGKCQLQTITCILPLSSDSFITGTANGLIYNWMGRSASKSYKAHTSTVHTLLLNNSEILSGGKDGLIIIWDLNMKKQRQIDLNTYQFCTCLIEKDSKVVPPSKVQIKSLCMKDGKLLVGTIFSEIYEIQYNKLPTNKSSIDTIDSNNINKIVSGHYADELWGLAINPTKPNECCTVGDDHTIRIFDCLTYTQIKGAILPSMSRACAYTVDGKNIICGLGGRVGKKTNDKYEGMVIAINEKTLKITKTRHDSKQWISDVKVSPCGSIIAVGSHDNYIYLYKWPGLQYTTRCKGHSSYITHFDFSKDSRYLQSNCGAYELLFWSTNNGKQITASSSLKDVKWSSQTCVLGWGVQGIWPECSDGTDVNSLDLSPKGDVLVTADDFGLVKLFRYPCVNSHSPFSSYIGHSSHVTNVRFTPQFDKSKQYVWSTGGNDRSVFQWKYESDDRDPNAFNNIVEDNEDDGLEHMSELTHPFEDRLDGGDEFLAVKPWIGAIHEPDHHPPVNPSAPDVSIDIKWAFGYQAQDVRNNLRYSYNDSLVYHTAALGISFHVKENIQYYNQNHNDDIVSLAIHPELKVVATGQLGAKPKIVIWDAESGEMIKELTNYHKRAVILIAFNKNGDLLASIGQDDNHSIAIYDWQKAKIKAQSKGDVNKVLDICWDDNNVVAQCGVKHIKFWEFQGQNISSRRGILGSKGKQQTFISIEYCSNSGNHVVGCNDGSLYIFNGRDLGKIVSLKMGPVYSLYSGKNDLLCGVAGSKTNPGGRIIRYDTNNNTKEVIIVDELCKEKNIILQSSDIRSICYNSDESKILIGTKGSEVLEITGIKSKKYEIEGPLVVGHCADELWGLAMNPMKWDECCTAGDDQTLRFWNLEKFRQKDLVQLDCMSRAICYHPNGDAIVAGLGGRVGKGSVRGEGGIVVITYNKEKGKWIWNKNKRQDAKAWISDVKFTPKGDKFAVGSHDQFIYIYNFSRDNPTLFKKLSGHSSYITHFDFSTNGKYLQSTCGAYELLFWDVSSGKQITSSSSMKNTEWSSQTCVLGWGVQGIWPECSDGTDVNSLDKDIQTGLLATSDDFGLVKLFNYPCVTKKSNFVQGTGHSSFVQNIRFDPFQIRDSNNPRSRENYGYLVSTGGNDRCTIVWSFERNGTEQENNLLSLDNGEDNDNDDDDENDDNNILNERTKELSSKDAFQMPSSGDEFMAVKPWLGAIFAPSKPPPVNPALPRERLELNTAFGYASQTCRNNLRYTNTGNIVYHVAAVGIIQPPKSPQIFHIAHQDDITCLCIDPTLSFVATGELGPKPFINVWDSTTGELCITIKGYHKKGILALSFSPDGKKLATVGQDGNHSIALYGKSNDNWTKVKLIGSDKGDGNNTLFVEWLNDGTFMSGGVKHGNFWNASSVTKKRALFKSAPITNLVCAAALNESTMVCGTSKGPIYMFTGNSCTKVVKNHSAGVHSIYKYSNGLITGDKSGKMIIWDSNMKETYSLNLSDICQDQIVCLDYGLASLCFSDDESKLLIGTMGSDILELEIDIDNKSTGKIERLAAGHCKDELWGCTVAVKDSNKIISVGDDNSLRMWSISKRAMTGIVKLPRMARAVDYSVDGKLLCVGLGGRMGGTRSGSTKGTENENLGGFIIYDFKKLSQVNTNKSNIDNEIKSCIISQNLEISKSHVSDVKFSPNGQYLAVGTHDTKVYIYSQSDSYQKCVATCKAGHSYISHFDFSTDSKYLQVTYGDYELLFYDMKGKHINTPSSLKDVKWYTQSCVLGWPVQGIWANTSDGTDINYCDRSHSNELLVSGDDFGKVRLYRYPVLTKDHQYFEGVGHSSHVPMVRFSCDDRYVISTGGNDRALMVWSLIV